MPCTEDTSPKNLLVWVSTLLLSKDSTPAISSSASAATSNSSATLPSATSSSSKSAAFLAIGQTLSSANFPSVFTTTPFLFSTATAWSLSVMSMPICRYSLLVILECSLLLQEHGRAEGDSGIWEKRKNKRGVVGVGKGIPQKRF